MKKTILYSLAILATVGFASCNEDYDDWASPQSYSQEEAAAKYGVSFANGPEANAVLPDSDGVIRLVQINNTDSAISGVTLKSITVNGQAFNGTVDGNYITVPATDLAKLAYTSNGTRAAKALPLNVETEVAINLANGDAVTFDTKGQTTGSITPEAVPAADPKGYFMLGHFAENGNGWDLNAPIWMTDNGDGTYSANVTTTQFNTTNYFAFYGGSSYDAANPTWDAVNAAKIGAPSDGDLATDEYAVWNNDPVYGTPQSAGIFSTGTWTITLDPVNMTYKVRRAESVYYVYNYANRYNAAVPTSGHRLTLYANGDNIYTLTTNWRSSNDIKLWDPANFGNSAMFFGFDATDAAAESKAESGTVAQGPNTGFISAPSAGWYKFTLDMNSSTYKWEAVSAPTKTYTSVSVAGQSMTHLTNAPHNWYKEITLSAATQVHFTANDGTTWGAAEAGKTISATKYAYGVGKNDVTVPAGTYRFYLNDIDGTWNIIAE